MEDQQHCPLCGRQYGPEVPFCPDDMSDLVRGPASDEPETHDALAPAGSDVDGQLGQTASSVPAPAGTAPRPATAPSPEGRTGVRVASPAPGSPASQTSLDRPTPSTRILLVIDGSPAALREGDKVVLGRDPALATATTLSPHDNVSRIHCAVELRGGHLIVTDLGSTNGTFIDGRRLSQDTPTEVSPDSRLRLARDVDVEIVR